MVEGLCLKTLTVADQKNPGSGPVGFSANRKGGVPSDSPFLLQNPRLPLRPLLWGRGPLFPRSCILGRFMGCTGEGGFREVTFCFLFVENSLDPVEVFPNHLSRQACKHKAVQLNMLALLFFKTVESGGLAYRDVWNLSQKSRALQL